MSKVNLRPIEGLTIVQLKEFIKQRIDKDAKLSRYNKGELIKYIEANFKPKKSDFIKCALSGTRDDYDFIKTYKQKVDTFLAIAIITNAAISYHDGLNSYGKEIIRYIINIFDDDMTVLGNALYICQLYNSSLTDYVQDKIKENTRPATPMRLDRQRY